MNAEPGQVKAVFLHAVESCTPGEWDAYLDQACGENAELRRRVMILLEAHQTADSLIGRPEWTATFRAGLPGSDQPGAVIGPYKLLQKIGEGGMGTVFMAEQTAPVRRRVALKLINPGMDSRQVVARFEAERQALALMDHPNIARVFEAGTTDSGRPYFVMELVRGAPITNYCDEHHLTLRERLGLFVPMCQAVQHAHQKGIIHRDLKPSNVLVAEYDDKPVAKVIDFGVAKAIGSKLTDGTMFTEFGQVVGTLEYMSPEQAKLNALDIDTRSDIYALGVLLYELLTGTTPFERERLQQAAFDEMLRIIREVEPPKPSTRISTTEELPSIAANRSLEPKKLSILVRGELDWIVMKCLEKDRDRRYETANGLARDIERYLHDEPLEASPPSAGYRVRKWARRHEPVVWSVSLSALALLLLTVVGLAFLIVIDRRALLQETQAKEKVHEALGQVQREAYFQRVASAHGELLAHNPGRGEELLDACAPPGDEPDLRGWEWYYLRRMRHGGPLVFTGHGAEVRGVAFSPDSRRIASGGFDGAVRVWEAGSGMELLVLKTGSPVFGVALSGDGKWLAGAGMDGLVRLWDLTKSPEAPVVLRGHTGQVYAVAFSPDGQSLASGGADKIVRVWPLTPGQQVLALEGHAAPVWSVAFRPDGRRLASASFDETVRIWDMAAGRAEGAGRLLHTLTGHGEPVNCVAFSPDGRRLASAAFGPNIKLWDADTGAELQTLRGHTLIVYGVAFSPDGRRLASAGVDKTVKLWDGATGREILTLHGHTHFVNGVTYSPDGHRLASAGRDGAVRVWDATPLGETTGQELATIRGHSGLVVRLAFSPDGQRLASASSDKTVKIWDAALGLEVCTLRDHTKLVHGLAFSPDGRRLATASWDRTVRVWDAATGRALLTLRGHNGGVDSVAFSPDGNRLASGSLDGTVRLWDAATGEPLQVFRGHTGMVIGVLFSHDGGLVLSSANDGTIRVWRPETGEELPPFLGHSGPVFGLALSPDGTRLAAASYDGAVKLWASAARKELHTFRGETDTFTEVAFSPDGMHLAAANWDAVLVWDTESRQRVGRLRAHRGVVWSLAFSPDGNRLASGSGYADQGEIKLWDMTALTTQPGR
jgi:WD40 repeat protein/serine/threonine protein kinase